jgi:hypothetical protein
METETSAKITKFSLKRLDPERRLLKAGGNVEEFLGRFGPDRPLTESDFEQVAQMSVTRSTARRLRHNLQDPRDVAKIAS